MDRARVYRQIEKDFEKHVEELLKLVRQPSVSPQNIGVREAAGLLREMAGQAGFKNTSLVETSGNPVVYGELNVGAPLTVLVYTMYDTMPADEPGWKVDPFAGEILRVEPFGETLVARGAVNTKGPLVALLNTVRAIVESGQEPPVNLIFAAEGEEELGSKHLPEFIGKCEDQLKKADVLFFPGASQNSKGKAIVTLGVKGIIFFELELDGKEWGKGPTEFGIHGSNKAWVDSPAWRMVKALSTMVDETGNRVLIEGFYDDVRVPSEEDEALLSRLAGTFDEDEVKERMKVERFIDDLHGVEALKKYLFSPTLNIDGLWSGYTGPGSKTLLPHRMTVKMDVRLVPEMRVEKTMSLVREHLDKHGFSEIRIRRLEEGYGWARMSVNSPYSKALLKALGEFNVEIEVWPTIAGSAPFSMFAAPPLGLPFIVGGMGHGGLAHSPNEYLVMGEGGPTGGLLTMEKSFAAILDHVSTLKNQ